MSAIVVDASVLVPALTDDADLGRRVRDTLRGQQLNVPHLVDVEVASAVRGLHRGGHLTAPRAKKALAMLAVLPMVRVPMVGLLDGAWRLRENLTVYDSVYVVLAQLLDAPLLTADAGMARIARRTCSVELLTAA